LVIPAQLPEDGVVQLAAAQQSIATDAPSMSWSPPAATPRANRDVVVVRTGSTNARTHTVRQGDTLFALAKRYNTSVGALRKLNNLPNDRLSRGKRLRIPSANARS